MPRRGRAPKHAVMPDPKYNSVLLSRLINKIMKDGKKSIAQRIVYDAMDIIEERTSKDPLDLIEQAIKNVTPQIEVRSRRVGGANYQIPVEVRFERQLSLALRWLIESTRKGSGHTMAEKLARELLDAANNTGITIKKREDTHRMAEANKAYAHYRW
ncbi:MAG: 30S ribosomal protein S7 [Chloroflexi bacterium]|nr:30S ribosomal protein S7 [Chloroflexota bacterium]